MSPRRHRGPSLEAELAELERTDPAVAKAAANLERVKREIVSAPIDVEALRARIVTLEKHRDQWRRIAFRLYDAASEAILDVYGDRVSAGQAGAPWAELVAAVEQLEDSDVNDGTRP